mgnify:CR=1 FL=1
MSAKYLIFGATGSIGSNLANKLYNSSYDFHLVSRNEEELKKTLEKYSNDTSFYLKSDFSKNPNHIYFGTREELLNTKINWKKDRYYKEFYILQTKYISLVQVSM